MLAEPINYIGFAQLIWMQKKKNIFVYKSSQLTHNSQQQAEPVYSSLYALYTMYTYVQTMLNSLQVNNKTKKPQIYYIEIRNISENVAFMHVAKKMVKRVFFSYFPFTLYTSCFRRTYSSRKTYFMAKI